MATTLPLFPSSGTSLINPSTIKAGMDSVIAQAHEGDERLLAAWAIQEGLASLCAEIHGRRMTPEAKEAIVQRAHEEVEKVRREMAGLSPTRQLALLASFSKSTNEEVCGEELWRKP